MIDYRIKEFDEFEENLKNLFDKKEVKSIFLSYLIDESYMKEIRKYIDNLRKNKNSNQNFTSSPKIFNNFESAMKHLENNSKLYLISKKLITLIHPNYDLNKYTTVMILGGIGKLIIYFDHKNAFLLFKNKNSNEVELNKNNLYIIHEDSKQKNHSYKIICNQKIDYNKSDKNYDYISSFIDFNNGRNIKHQNDGNKAESKYEKPYSSKHIIRERKSYLAKYNTPTITKIDPNKEQNYHPFSSIGKRRSNYEGSKINNNNQYDSNKAVEKIIKNNYNINGFHKKLSYNIDEDKKALYDELKLKINKKQQNELKIKALQDENRKLEARIKEIKEKLEKFGNNYKRMSSSILSGDENNIETTYISGKYNSSIQNRNENIRKKYNDFSKKRDGVKNEINNQQKTNEDNNCEIMKKKSDENYTLLQVSHAKKRKKMKSKSKSIPSNESIKSFHNPTLVKLDYVKKKLPNYIYSIIYCLSQIDDLTNYFLTGNCIQTILNNEHSDLSLEYDSLIHGLWSKKNIDNKFWPNDFMAEISQMSIEYGLPYESNDPNDIHYFIVFILEQMHRELKTSKNINNKLKDAQYDQYDQNNVIKCIDDFKEESSIISKLFFGFKETTEECLNCNNNANLENKILCYNYEMFNCLVFPLDEIKNEINSNNVTIVDCFNYIQKTQLFTGDKRNYCNKCEQVYDSNFTTTIYEFPEVLILVFVRNKESGNNVKLNFEEKINTQDLNLGAEVNTGIVFKSQIYNLCGVISYKEGTFIDYIAACKSPVDKSWYRYTSSEITPINDVQNDLINYETPYVLFYKKGK